MSFPVELTGFFLFGGLAIALGLFWSSPRRAPGKATGWSWLVLALWAGASAALYARRDYAGDTEMYVYQFENILTNGFELKGEWAFDGLVLFLDLVGFGSPVSKFFWISFLISFLIGASFLNMSGDKGWLGFAILVNSFFFYSMQTVVIRQGVAVGLVLLGFSSIATAVSWKSVRGLVGGLCFVLAFAFHNSVLIFFACALGALFLKRWLWLGWVVLGASTVLSYMQIDVFSFGPLQRLTQSFREGHFEMYTSGAISSYRIGFRFDFWLFVVTWAAVAFVLRTRFKQKSLLYDYLITLYLLLCSAFVMFFSLPFSDRVGVFAFMFIPLLLVIPCVGTITDAPRVNNRLVSVFSSIGMLSFSYIYFVLYRSGEI